MIAEKTRDQQILSNRTQEAMRTLITNCLENQKHFFSHRDHSPRFLEDYCTVKISCGRQTGQTTAAVKLAHNMFEHSVFIASTTFSRSYAKEIFRKIDDKSGHSIYFCTFLSLERAYGYPTQAVFVDGASALSQQTLEDVYSVCRRFLKANDEKLFVVVLIA